MHKKKRRRKLHQIVNQERRYYDVFKKNKYSKGNKVEMINKSMPYMHKGECDDNICFNENYKNSEDFSSNNSYE